MMITIIVFIFHRKKLRVQRGLCDLPKAKYLEIGGARICIKEGSFYSYTSKKITVPHTFPPDSTCFLRQGMVTMLSRYCFTAKRI